MSCTRLATLAALALITVVITGCAFRPGGPTLAGLHEVEPDLAEVRVEDSLEQAMVGYRKFLEEAPESSLTPEAMRRLADLKLEKQYGILGDGEIRELPVPPRNAAPVPPRNAAPVPPRNAAPAAKLAAPNAHSPGSAAADGPTQASRVPAVADFSESEQDFERRATGQDAPTPSSLAAQTGLELPGGGPAPEAGPLEAIALYDEILATYPDYEQNDQVLYQKARAFDELGRPDEAIAVIERLVVEYPYSRHLDEVQFRRAEYFFTRRRYFEAEKSYSAVTAMGPGSEYYELALYKLGWALYKQEFHDEALDQYVALLDYKVSNGYDFDQSLDEADERRITDTFRVISLSFSSLGGPGAVETYFASKGERHYEDRIYSHLGEYYLEKLRYQDAAASYGAFVALHPLHRAAPHFNMRVVEIYEAGGFPKLVLESKKEFAATYGLQSEYWRHFEVADAPEVLSYLKSNLGDLASHYHSLYQQPRVAEEKPEHFREASRWYRAYLDSFSGDPEAPAVHYRLADLLLEHEDFGEAAREYERTAYDYAAHEKAAEAGYAAIYAHREHEKRAGEAGSDAEQAAVREAAVASTLRFVDAFPGHEHAAVVLGAAVDDLYDMEHFERAIATAQALLESYPEAKPAIRRSAWAVVAHASFDTERYPQAEAAYGRVLEMTDEADEARQDVVENLAASIYQQGENANEREDYRAAADHFLRITQVAPDSGIRAAAEYDAGAALMRLEDWDGAASVLDDFRTSHPDHELQREATKQIASIHREQGKLVAAAGEYERVAAEASDPELRREALLLAGELYEDSGVTDRALAAYLRYVEQFPAPVELAVETRFKIAGIYETEQDEKAHREQLRSIVEIDAAAGEQRTARVRYLAARSAVVLAEDVYRRFDAVELVQPFEKSLQKKQRRMNTALAAFDGLVDYEVGEVTAAATYYMAEIYFEFSASLLASERPSGLAPAELQDYEGVLEEEAFPFEERSLAVHEKNLELMRTGVYNAWIEKSLAKLALLMPGRYAKFEQSSGWLDSLELYVYRAPNAPDPAAVANELAVAPVDPVAVEPLVVEPVVVESLAAEPASIEFVPAESVSVEPAAAESVSVEPVSGDLVDAPVAVTEPLAASEASAPPAARAEPDTEEIDAAEPEAEEPDVAEPAPEAPLARPEADAVEGVTDAMGH